MNTYEGYLEQQKDIPQLEAEYKDNLITAVNQMAEIAFNHGISIPALEISDTWIQIGLPYGNRHTIKAPNISEVETDFGVIKIKKKPITRGEGE